MANQKHKSKSHKHPAQKFIWVGLALVLIFAGMSMMQNRPAATNQQNHAAMGHVPDWLASYSSEIKEAYAYAAEHQDVLKFMSCYCGCENHGHASNAECYVEDIGPDGKIKWDSHAAT